MTIVIEEKFRTPIKTAVVAASAVGVPGIFAPGLDTAGVGVIWAGMVAAIARTSGHELNKAAATKLAAAALAGVSGYVLGSKILTWALVAVMPLAGIPTQAAVNAGLNGLFTLKLGIATARHFSRPNLTVMDVGELTLAIAHQLVPIPSIDEIRFLKEVLAA